MKNQARIRLVAWNIEKGKRWELIEKCLNADSLRSADVLCLNEVDEGMARSGNLRIAYEIGERLGMHVVFGQTFREFTKGIGEERLAPGENTTAIQGNATLTRFPVVDSLNLQLPNCHDPSRGQERRVGSRASLIVRLDRGSGRVLTIANSHLEVVTTARCRARQMRCVVDHIGTGPAVVCGDFNTNTFARGTALHTFRSLSRLFLSDVQSRVLSPWLYEPLFAELRAAGFSWADFNDSEPTCSVDLSSVEDRKYVPAFIRNRILDRVRILPLRLDFIVCRGLTALSPGRTITDLPCRPSDHLPITCDLLL